MIYKASAWPLASVGSSKCMLLFPKYIKHEISVIKLVSDRLI